MLKEVLKNVKRLTARCLGGCKVMFWSGIFAVWMLRGDRCLSGKALAAERESIGNRW